MKLIVALFSFLLYASVLHGQSRSDTVNVWTNDTVLRCRVDSIALDAGPGFVTYEWNTGDVSQLIWVKQSGTYTVTVFDGTNTESTSCELILARIQQDPSTICYQDEVFLSVVPDDINYAWSIYNNPNILGNNYFILVGPRARTTYACEVSIAGQSCTDTITIDVYPRMNVEFNQLSKICWISDCRGQVKADASGGLPPYSYNWAGALVDPADSSFAIGLCPQDQNPLFISDGYGCTLDTFYVLDLFSEPEIEIDYSPDSVYIQNPTVNFVYDNLSSDSIEVTNVSWDFGDGTKSSLVNPAHLYLAVNTYNGFFKYTTSDGCSDSIPFIVDVREIELDVPNVFTPNGDGINDYFEIKNLESYISNELVIYNRWGRKVFEASNYTNTWNGGSLTNGAYFYVLKCVGLYSTDEYIGSITIMGKVE
jgi:gliding motility-associated-like protein